jgi:NitT/TauT family transport system substrate-binding protein
MKRLPLLAALLVLLASTVPVRAQTPDLIPLKVLLGDVSTTKIMFLVAADAGIYAKNGLDVDQFITPRAAAVVRRSGVIVPAQFVRTGEGEEVPITVEGGSPRMVGMTNSATGADRVIIATTDNTARFHVIARKGITSLRQLKGKRLGYSVYGSISHMMAIEFAKSMGWDPVHDISLMADGSAMDVLRSGKVDALVADEIVQGLAVREGFHDLLNLTTLKIPLAGSGVNASRSWLRTHRDIASRFIKSTVEARALISTNKQVAFAALAKWYNITDPAQQEAVYKQVTLLPRKPYPAVDGIKEVMKIYNYHEMRIHTPEFFYDSSFVRALDRSGYIEGLYKS